MTGEVKQVYGSPTTVISIALPMANGYVAGNTTLLDNSFAQYPNARAVLHVASFASASTANTVVTLWSVPQDIDNTLDSSNGSTVDGTPSAESARKSTGGARYIGAFPLSNYAGAQDVEIIVSLRGIIKSLFFVKNESGQTLNAGVGTECTVKITPFSFGPT